MKKLVMFGAGNIGRGFFAQLFFESGYETVFIDINEAVVNELNRRKGYILEIIGGKAKKVEIKNVRAVDGKELSAVAQELKTADIAATAVGVNVLKNICPALAAGIRARADSGITLPLNIIIGENMINAGAFVHENVKELLEPEYHAYVESSVGFVETVLGRMIPVMPETLRKKDPLYIMVEEFCTLPVAKHGFKGDIPVIKNMIPGEHFLSFEERKLFIHNLGHAVCAYLGYLHKHEFIWQAVGDPIVKKYIKSAMNESGSAIIKKHNLPPEEVHNYIDDLLARFANKSLGDTVARVGKDPIRKLGPIDRLVGAARLVIEQGGVPDNIALGMAAVMFFNPQGDEAANKVQKVLKENGLGCVLENISGLKSKDVLFKMVEKKFELLKSNINGI
ncbi:MAG: hypothetical protein A2452_05070 [Candidatus Firestonebacteria bacterium RIFOXYC2_FULL_39_67]|nr:MAG: hypothetical protein A2536_04895 [Candidatus Firestonebacteria bacterium RIFOXYD2_FULL_39_29]OGF57258.1 MAG: hypothetical protein A2452_05070 [Candidatus Firestonebacteria bacterium RIFOXYC2_FULL_39_67]